MSDPPRVMVATFSARAAVISISAR